MWDFSSPIRNRTYTLGTFPCMLSHFSRVQFFATLWYDCSPPGSSVHGILQVRILEWVAMPCFRQSSRPRDRTHMSMFLILAGGFFTTSIPRQPYKSYGRKAEERRLFLNPRLPGMGGSQRKCAAGQPQISEWSRAFRKDARVLQSHSVLKTHECLHQFGLP